ncbi:MAG: hypothetical protein WBA00_01230 [Rhodococcus sp. (in: high G+C Gram-positive bacteria)]
MADSPRVRCRAFESSRTVRFERTVSGGDGKLVANTSGSAGTQRRCRFVSIQHQPLNLSETLEGDSNIDNPYGRHMGDPMCGRRFVNVNGRHKQDEAAPGRE